MAEHRTCAAQTGLEQEQPLQACYTVVARTSVRAALDSLNTIVVGACTPRHCHSRCENATDVASSRCVGVLVAVSRCRGLRHCPLTRLPFD